MSTIITATNITRLDPVTLSNVLKNVKGTMFTTYEVYDDFKPAAVNRPKTFLLNLLEHDVVDIVIQVGYNGTKTEIVRTAEELGLEVILFRSMA